MNDETVDLASSRPWNCHLDLTSIHGSEAMDGCRGPMTEKRAWSGAQNSGHEGGLGRQPLVADREDVVMDRRQPAIARHAPDLAAAKTEVLQLAPRHNVPLASR
jgi:hypothetical protein